MRMPATLKDKYANASWIASNLQGHLAVLHQSHEPIIALRGQPYPSLGLPPPIMCANQRPTHGLGVGNAVSMTVQRYPPDVIG